MGTTLTTLVTGLLVLGLLACSPAAANENAGTMHRTLVAGTLIQATTQGVLSSRRNRAGETLTALVSGDVEDALGQVVIPAGSTVALRIARLDGTVALDVTSVTVRDQEYPVSSRVEPPHLLRGTAPALWSGQSWVESPAPIPGATKGGWSAGRSGRAAMWWCPRARHSCSCCRNRSPLRSAKRRSP